MNYGFSPTKKGVMLLAMKFYKRNHRTQEERMKTTDRKGYQVDLDKINEARWKIITWTGIDPRQEIQVVKWEA